MELIKCTKQDMERLENGDAYLKEEPKSTRLARFRSLPQRRSVK